MDGSRLLSLLTRWTWILAAVDWGAIAFILTRELPWDSGSLSPSFLPSVFIEHMLFARQCSRHWGSAINKARRRLLSSRLLYYAERGEHKKAKKTPKPDGDKFLKKINTNDRQGCVRSYWHWVREEGLSLFPTSFTSDEMTLADLSLHVHKIICDLPLLFRVWIFTCVLT